MTIRQKGLLFIVFVALGSLFSYLFYLKPIGISLPIFLAAASLAYYLVLREHINVKSPAAWLFLVAAAILAKVQAVYNHPLTNLNLVLIPLSFVASTILFTRKNTYHWFDPRALSNIFPTFFGRTLENLGKPFRVIHELITSKISGGNGSVAHKIALGVAVSVPFLLLIFVLLSSADPVFKHIFARPPEWFLNADWYTIVGYTFIGLLAYTGLSSYAFALLQEYRDEKHQILTLKKSQDSVVAITVLSLVNVVYVMFVIVQFSYLFGGKDLSFLENFTYAEYARQGFAQLVLVTLINISVIMTSLYTAREESRFAHAHLRVLLALMATLTLVILASAFYRMSLYQDAYGFTHLRVFVHVFEVWLGVVLVALLARIFSERVPFAQTFVVSAIAIYVALNCTNIDAFIARKNLSASHDAVPLDAPYIQQLSVDAMEQRIQLAQQMPQGSLEQIAEKQLIQSYHALQNQPWQGWNWHKQKAIKALKAHLNLK